MSIDKPRMCCTCRNWTPNKSSNIETGICSSENSCTTDLDSGPDGSWEVCESGKEEEFTGPGITDWNFRCSQWIDCDKKTENKPFFIHS